MVERMFWERDVFRGFAPMRLLMGRGRRPFAYGGARLLQGCLEATLDL